MQILETIAGRSSAKKFGDHGLPIETIEGLLRCAARAPDHGLLSPWRFIVLLDEGRKDHIVGFVHVGVPTEMKPVRSVDLDAVTRWVR
ncbi:MAG: hypothetical protein EBR15_03305 [Gammaproteobacteria bacterium]|nr:hypothetical protein [Gammaproteobacteria bacterium]